MTIPPQPADSNPQARRGYDRTEDIAQWTPGEHMAEACRLMDGPDVGPEDWAEARADNLATAQAHLAFATVLFTAKGTVNRPVHSTQDLIDLYHPPGDDD